MSKIQPLTYMCIVFGIVAAVPSEKCVLSSALERGRLVNVSIPSGDASPYDQRFVLVYVPKLALDSQSSRHPAILTLHGFGSNPIWNLDMTGLVTDSEKNLADEYGWVVAAPYGSGTGPPSGCADAAFPCGWNAGGWSTSATSNRSDVKFLSSVADWLVQHACVEKAQVFSTGISAGAMMANRLACEASTVFQGVAPMAGTVILGGDFLSCVPKQTISWVSFCGTEDGVCTKPEYGSLGQKGSFDLFAANCSNGSLPTYVTPTTRCEAYRGCPNGAIVENCMIIGLGHAISGRGFQEPGHATDVDAMRYALNRLSLSLSRTLVGVAMLV